MTEQLLEKSMTNEIGIPVECYLIWIKMILISIWNGNECEICQENDPILTLCPTLTQLYLHSPLIQPQQKDDFLIYCYHVTLQYINIWMYIDI